MYCTVNVLQVLCCIVFLYCIVLYCMVLYCCGCDSNVMKFVKSGGVLKNAETLQCHGTKIPFFEEGWWSMVNCAKILQQACLRFLELSMTSPPPPPTPPPSFPLVTKYPYFFIKQSKPEDLSGLLPSLWNNIKIKGTRQTYTTVSYESAN